MRIEVIGIIGGLSPESTVVYYKGLNDGVRERTGRQHQAKIIMVSVDGGEIWKLRERGDWEGQGQIVADAASILEAAGAAFVLLAGNTMHRCAEQIEEAIDVPFLHVVDATAETIREAGVGTIGLTGTSFTMTERFYVDRLASYGIRSVVPPKPEMEALDRIIYRELCWGEVTPQSREEFAKIAGGLVAQGAEGIILGCTELTLLRPFECSVPLFDTTRIHIRAAIDHAMP
jgi:aspartate racemase